MPFWASSQLYQCYRLGKTFINSKRLMLCQPRRQMFVFSKTKNSFSGADSPLSVNQFQSQANCTISHQSCNQLIFLSWCCSISPPWRYHRRCHGYHYSIFNVKSSRLKTQKYLFDHYLHFLKLHIINNYINSLFIWSRRLPLRPHVVAGMGATFMKKKIHLY